MDDVHINRDNPIMGGHHPFSSPSSDIRRGESKSQITIQVVV